MRTVLIIITLIIISILSIPMYLVEFIIGKFNPKLMHSLAQNIVRAVFKLWLFIAGTDYEVYGVSKVPKDEAVLYVSNHRSYFDIILSYAYVPNLAAFVSKVFVKKIPCVGIWMHFLSCMFLDRDDIKSGMRMIKDSVALIKRGISVYVAPEGTRNPTDELLPFKDGCFKIATMANCKIVPICYTNTEGIFEAHFPWVRKTHATIEFGDPVDTAGMSREEKKALGGKMREIIQKMYDERRQSRS